MVNTQGICSRVMCQILAVLSWDRVQRRDLCTTRDGPVVCWQLLTSKGSESQAHAPVVRKEILAAKGQTPMHLALVGMELLTMRRSNQQTACAGGAGRRHGAQQGADGGHPLWHYELPGRRISSLSRSYARRGVPPCLSACGCRRSGDVWQAVILARHPVSPPI